MAYLIIVVGALMGLFGAYETYVGNAIISVERGWSAFIAGSVLIAGGVVTVAIGLAVRTLENLRSTLARLPATAPLPSELPVTAVEPHHLGDAGEPPAITPAPIVPAVAAERPDLLPTPPSIDAHPVELVPAPSRREMAAEKPATPSEPSNDTVPDLRLRPSLDAEPVASPAMDDWLERSFADLDHDTSLDAARAAATRAHAGPEHEILVPPAHRDIDKPPAQQQQLAHAEIEQPVATIDATALDHAAPSSSVIGRYESDGTSYVMYADGSIEAQSAAGIYRFASMAELKDFIES